MQWENCYNTQKPPSLFMPHDNHPAPMSWGLTVRIATYGEHMGWWKPGDLIGDPMAGSGTGLTAYRIRGYDVCGIELESTYYARLLLNTAWQNKNLGLSQVLLPGMVKPGSWDYHHGDASVVLRELEADSWDACMFSPPYESAVTSNSDGPMMPFKQLRAKFKTEKEWRKFATDRRAMKKAGYGGLVADDAQVGNLKGYNHWKAMLDIYRGIAHVVRPGGFLVTVTKDRRQKWQMFPIFQYTIALAVMAGFDIVHLHDGKWPNRIRAMGAMRSQVSRMVNAKYIKAGRPDLYLDHEDVLVFAKPTGH